MPLVIESDLHWRLITSDDEESTDNSTIGQHGYSNLIPNNGSFNRVKQLLIDEGKRRQLDSEIRLISKSPVNCFVHLFSCDFFNGIFILESAGGAMWIKTLMQKFDASNCVLDPIVVVKTFLFAIHYNGKIAVPKH
ncbi:1-aminomutase,Glutamate-1-semialdehyde 2 [Trichinella pseudospiralis]